MKALKFGTKAYWRESYNLLSHLLRSSYWAGSADKNHREVTAVYEFQAAKKTACKFADNTEIYAVITACVTIRELIDVLNEMDYESMHHELMACGVVLENPEKV